MEQIIKSVQPNESQLEQINRYSRRELSLEEVYTFSIVLCDNEVDRDMEAFSKESLYTLAKLFLGKTGIFDHDARGKNQSARIFNTEVEQVVGETTSYGEPYYRLKAQAYTVRSERLRDLILEIDAGIKKEVSIGCSVARRICSICGENLSHRACEHIPGREYGGRLCFIKLEEPTDAYEWSFVAVPAQKNAGVVKSFLKTRTVKKMSEALTPKEAEEFSNFLGYLEKEAQIGRHHLEALRKEVLKLSFLANFMTGSKVFAKLVERMSLQELQEFIKEFKKRVNPLSATPQLVDLNEETQPVSENKAFLI